MPAPRGGISERIRLLDAVLQGAGFEARASPDIARAMWEKWVQLASLGALTCLMRGTIGNVVAAEGGLELEAALVSLRVYQQSVGTETRA